MTDNDDIKEHESFGFISASRVSGGVRLFDSALTHHHFVEINIGSAKQERRHGQTCVFPKEVLTTVRLTENQFAQFITRMNQGIGAPCTLVFESGQHYSPPPADVNTKKAFDKDVDQASKKIAQQVQRAINQLNQLLAQPRASKSDLAELKGQLEILKTDIGSNLPYLLECFAEAMEKLTDQAKQDIEGFALMTRLGLDNTAPHAIEDGHDPES